MPARILLLLFASFLLTACEQPAPAPRNHVLQGAWLADDGTIFIFRPDGTFHGVDFRRREIWGNWVKLSNQRIGFQSLLHDSYYNPQYAIIDPDDANAMDYIVTGGNNFIRAKRIPATEAQFAVDLIIAPEIHRPERD
jgi:hypothetical protein